MITPEGVVFEYTLAGHGTRFCAFALDATLSAVVAIIGLLLVSAAQGASLGGARVGFGQGVAALLGLLVVFGAQWAYYVVSEWAMGGQTVGKRVFGLRVVTTAGLRLRFGESVVRNLLRLVDAFPVAALVAHAHPALHLVPLFILPGALASLLSSRHQRLGDLAAGTLVVLDRRGPTSARTLQTQDGAGAWARVDTVQTRLRRALGPEAVELLVALCARRDVLELQARLELFREAAARVAQATGIERPESLSDERYVLDLVLALTSAPPRRGEGTAASPATGSARP